MLLPEKGNSELSVHPLTGKKNDRLGTMTKILIIGYSALSKHMMRVILESGGYEVIEAENGVVGLERYSLDKPVLVMFDITSEWLHNIILTTIAKLREIDPEVRVIVTTTDIQRSTRSQVEALGVRGLIQKPLKREEVLKAVAETLKG
jgi:DNA-binding NarL/FixJ family response regulator